jgi:hypothetical protein
MAEEMRGRVVGGEGREAEIDGGYFGGYVKPANVKAHRRDRRLTRKQNGKRKVVVIVRERNGIRSRQFSIRKAKLLHSFARVSRRERLFMLTKQHHGMVCMSVSRLRESTIRRHTASMARALTWLRNTSPACAGPRSAFTTTLPGHICSDTRESRHGGDQLSPGQSRGLVSLKFTFVLSEERVPCGYLDKLLLSEQY